jgi:hypothetical protein
MVMKRALLIVPVTLLPVLAISCGTPPAAPSGAPSQAVSLAGTWNGTATDSQGATTVSWALTQTGTSVAGPVQTQAVNPADGSCNSCHRNKTGTFSGTISGTTLTLKMFFAAGAAGDPTPACTATLTGAASSMAQDNLTAAYTGADSCEGAFLNGTLAMARRP